MTSLLSKTLRSRGGWSAREYHQVKVLGNQKSRSHFWPYVATTQQEHHVLCELSKFPKKLDNLSQLRMCWFVVFICSNSILQVWLAPLKMFSAVLWKLLIVMLDYAFVLLYCVSLAKSSAKVIKFIHAWPFACFDCSNMADGPTTQLLRHVSLHDSY